MHRQCGRGRGRRWRFGASVDGAAPLAAARGEQASTANMKTEVPDTAAKSAPAKRRARAKHRSEPMPQSARRVAEPDPAPRDATQGPPAPETAPRASAAAPRPSAKSGGLDGFRVQA